MWLRYGSNVTNDVYESSVQHYKESNIESLLDGDSLPDLQVRKNTDQSLLRALIASFRGSLVPLFTGLASYT